MKNLTKQQTEVRDNLIAECNAKGIILTDEKIKFLNAMVASFEK